MSHLLGGWAITVTAVLRGPFEQQCALAVCTYNIPEESAIHTIIEVMSLMAFVRANWHCPER